MTSSGSEGSSGDRARLRQIAKVFAKHGLRGGVTNPARLRMALEELGPTFVKIGQMLSTRSDILPEDFTAELRKLQDDVGPVKFDTVRRIVEENLGGSLSSLFAAFEEEPVASASVAQVHLARIPEGDRVVVKVQRPGIREEMMGDIRVLMRLVRMTPVLFLGRVVDLDEVLDEFLQVTEHELDFRNEAANIERFADNNRDVRCLAPPTVFPAYTTSNVLVMGFVDGTKITDVETLVAEGYDLHDIGLKLAANYFKQVLVDGFFHGDPHPGNIFVAGNRISYIDFGIMGSISPALRRSFNALLTAFVGRDVDAMTTAVEGIAGARGAVDRNRLSGDVEQMCARYGDLSMAEMDLTRVIDDLFRVCRKNNLVVPGEMMLLLRGVVTLQGVVAAVAPEISLMKVAMPYAREHVLDEHALGRELGVLLQDLYASSRAGARILPRLGDLLSRAVEGRLTIRFHHEGLDQAMAGVSKMANRLVFGLVLSSMVIASSLLTATGVGPTFYGISLLGFAGYAGAAIMGFWLLVTILRSGRM